MRSAILLLVLSAAILGSCTSAYKTGQTPDDVYFSPERRKTNMFAVRDDDNVTRAMIIMMTSIAYEGS
jgi:hypothetical protein